MLIRLYLGFVTTLVDGGDAFCLANRAKQPRQQRELKLDSESGKLLAGLLACTLLVSHANIHVFEQG